MANQLNWTTKACKALSNLINTAGNVELNDIPIGQTTATVANFTTVIVGQMTISTLTYVDQLSATTLDVNGSANFDGNVTMTASCYAAHGHFAVLTASLLTAGGGTGLSATSLTATNLIVNNQADIKILDASRIDRYRTAWVPSNLMTPCTASHATSETRNFVTNNIPIDVYAFDGTTREVVGFNHVFPEEWDRSTLKAKFYWVPATSCSAGDLVEWGIRAGALADNDAIDMSLGVEATISDTVLAGVQGDLHISAQTPSITASGSPGLNEMVHFKVARNPGGNDDMTEDAGLIGILLQFKEATRVAAW